LKCCSKFLLQETKSNLIFILNGKISKFQIGFKELKICNRCHKIYNQWSKIGFKFLYLPQHVEKNAQFLHKKLVRQLQHNPYKRVCYVALTHFLSNFTKKNFLWCVRNKKAFLSFPESKLPLLSVVKLSLLYEQHKTKF